MVNTNMLLSIAQRIEDEPQHFEMRRWGLEVDEDETALHEMEAPICGSAFCVAGWVMVVDGWQPVFNDYLDRIEVNGGTVYGRELRAWFKDGVTLPEAHTAQRADDLLGFTGERRPYFKGDRWSEGSPSLYHQFDLDRDDMVKVLRWLAQNPDAQEINPGNLMDMGIDISEYGFDPADWRG